MKRVVICMLAAVSMASLSQAADSAWNVDADGSWDTAGNWTADMPGAWAGTSSDDTAYFTNNLTANRTVTHSDNVAIGQVAFGQGGTGNLTIGDGSKDLRIHGGSSPAGGGLPGIHVVSGGGDNSTTIESNIRLGGNGIKSFSFKNDSDLSDLSIKGNIKNLGQNQDYTFYLEGDGAAKSEIVGSILDHNAVGETTTVVKRGAGTWTLRGDNEFTGGLKVEQGTIRYFSDGNTVLGRGTVTIEDGVTFEKANSSAPTINNDMVVNGNFRFEGNSENNDWSGNMDLTGGQRSIDVDADLALSGTLSNGSFAKEGSKSLYLAGDGTLTDVSVEEGGLYIDGNYIVTGNVTVRDFLGGNGTLDGNIVLDDAAQLNFSLTDTLTANGSSVDLGDLSVADLVGLGSSTENGTYTLIDGTASFDFSSVQNLGSENAYDLGAGKSAYFQEGSLQVVVIPEPATMGMVLAFGAGMIWIRRVFMV